MLSRHFVNWPDMASNVVQTKWVCGPATPVPRPIFRGHNQAQSSRGRRTIGGTCASTSSAVINSAVQALRLPVVTRAIVWGTESVNDPRRFASVNLMAWAILTDQTSWAPIGSLPLCRAVEPLYTAGRSTVALSKALGLPRPRCMFFRTCM